MTTISGHIALAWPANWSVRPRVTAKREAAGVESLRGGALHSVLRGSDRMTFEWMVSTRTSGQTQELQAQVRAALQAGLAAAPRWGWAHWATIASAPGANQVNFSVRPGISFIPGQWVAFQVAPAVAAARGQWAVHEVDAVATALGITTLTFATTITLPCAIGAAVYPLVFGRIESPADGTYVTGSRADINLQLICSSGTPLLP